MYFEECKVQENVVDSFTSREEDMASAAAGREFPKPRITLKNKQTT